MWLYSGLFSHSLMDWIVSSHNSYVKALMPNVTVFWDRAFKEGFKVKWGYKGGGPNSVGLASL